MLIHWAMVEYLPFAAYTIANKGVYKHNSENATNVEKVEIDFLIEKGGAWYTVLGERLQGRAKVIEYLKENPEKIKELESKLNF